MTNNYSYEKTPYMLYSEGINPIEKLESGIRFKSKISNLMISSAIKQGRYKVVQDNPLKLKDDRPVIYIANHTRFQDGPVMRTQIPNETYLLVGTQKLRMIDKLFFNATVTMYVDRSSKEDRKYAKDFIIKMLNRGHSFACFPEVTWNLTSDQLMMPMKWGYIIEAKEADAQIVPMVFVYDINKKECHVTHLNPIIYSNQKIDLNEENERIRNEMGQVILNHPSFVGLGINKQNTIHDILNEYPYYEYDKEQSYVLNKK